MNLEGRIDIVLQVSGDAVADVAVRSSRPQLAQRMMAGRKPAEAADLAGLMFSLCGRAQRIAALAACAAAGADLPEAADATRNSRRVLAEWGREHAWRLLLDWPEAMGQARQAARLQDLYRTGEQVEPLAAALDTLLAGCLLGEPAGHWLARDWAGFLAWHRAGRGSAASLFAGLDGGPDPAATETRLVPAVGAISADQVGELAGRALSDPSFCATPLWQGETAETGVLARQVGGPLVSAWGAARGRGSGIRLLARLVELAALPQRLRQGGPEVIRAWTLADGTGVAGVETSRGLLVHIARLDGGRVTDYRIISPTEWNFHPAGPMVAAMRRLAVDADPAADERLASAARRVALAFDPCVDYGVTVAYA